MGHAPRLFSNKSTTCLYTRGLNVKPDDSLARPSPPASLFQFLEDSGAELIKADGPRVGLQLRFGLRAVAQQGAHHERANVVAQLRKGCHCRVQ